MRDRSTPPADPNRRKVKFKSSTKGSQYVHHITPPVPGTADDPRVNGAIVAVFNSVYTGGELVPVGLPAEGWTLSGTNTYKYRGASTDAITRVVVRPDQISFSGSRGAWHYTLNEPSQGRVAMVLLMNNTVWCSDAPAKSSPSIAANDHVDKFVAEPSSPAPPFCVGP